MKSCVLCFFLSAALIAGCASTSTGVVPIGKDTYMVSIHGARGTSQGDMRAMAFREASVYCISQKREVQPLSVKSNGYIPYVRNAEAEVQFRCLSSDDPELKRPVQEGSPGAMQDRRF